MTQEMGYMREVSVNPQETPIDTSELPEMDSHSQGL